ncbi:MAG: tetratricopeptide repeat protein [Bacteroidia bacterium]|nr:tetratricopeptide repeat protein [Bacteroidia bacterium]MDW8158862.1 tetratricopeptide repeat protein [Bacteroidia bacterium]
MSLSKSSVRMKRVAILSLWIISVILLFEACNVAERSKSLKKPSEKDTLAFLNLQIQQYPQRAVLYKERAEYFYRKQLWDSAYQDINRAIALDSTQADFYFLKGFFLFSHKKDSLALLNFQKAIQLNKELAEAYYLIGNIYFLQKQFPQALEWYQKALAKNASEPTYFFATALCYKQMGNIDRAKYFALLSLKKDSLFIKSLSLMYDIHMENPAEWNKAIEYNNKILSVDSTHPQAQFNLAFYWFKNANNLQGEQKEIALKKAILYYSRAIFVSPNFANAYYQRGYCYRILGNKARALEDFEKAIALNPNDYRAYYHAALIYKEYLEKEKAKSYLQKAVSIQPQWQEAQKELDHLP